MTREIWSALWQLQIAITSECVYQRHWKISTGGFVNSREYAGTHQIFFTQVRDRLFWDETLRGLKQAV